MRGRLISYSDVEKAWVKDHKLMPRRDLHAAFVKKFGRNDVSLDNIRSLCTRNKWSAGPEGRRRTKGKCSVFSVEEIAWIEDHASTIRKHAHALFCKEFDRSDVTFSAYNGFCKRRGITTGRTGQFGAGQSSWNKGKKMPHNPNSAKTQFKKGQVPANRVPLWTERLGKDGYVEMKVPLPNPFVQGQQTRFMHKHRYLWEESNGPLPVGHVLKCLDGDKTNCAPSNWEAIPRGMLPRLNGKCRRDYDTAPAEIKPTIMAIAKVEQKIFDLRRDGAT